MILEKLKRIIKEAEKGLESNTFIFYNESINKILKNGKNNKKKFIKNTYKKITNQEKAILDSKIRQNEFFMEGEHTATVRTSNYLYLVELFNVSELTELQVIKKRKIK